MFRAFCFTLFLCMNVIHTFVVLNDTTVDVNNDGTKIIKNITVLNDENTDNSGSEIDFDSDESSYSDSDCDSDESSDSDSDSDSDESSDSDSDESRIYDHFDDFSLLIDNETVLMKMIHQNPVPSYFDWRDKGMVTPVKDQGRCAACWAFSAVANIESHLKIHTNVMYILSEQFLIDCDISNKGCASASILQTFGNIVTKFGGVLKNEDYREYSQHRDCCNWKPPLPKPIPVIGFRRVLSDEEVMAYYLANYGPLSAAINSASMDKYNNGTFIDEPTDEECSPSPKNLNHAILIVGYNVFVSKKTGRNVPYWIIKNSWGTKWGDKGYYYLVRGRNACGIASDVSFAFVN